MDTSVLIVSSGYIFATAFLVAVTRSILLSFVTSPFLQRAILEFLATFEFLATVFEIGILLQTYGLPAFVIALIVMANYWGRSWRGATAAPHNHIVDMIKGNGSKVESVGFILAEICAASLVFPFYVKQFWGLGFLPIHTARLAGVASCSSFLKVGVYNGAFLEAFGTLAFNICAKMLRTMQYNFLTVPGSLAAIKIVGMSLTGGFLNPILASTLQFNCAGNSAWEHVLVYWLGPVVGLTVFTMLLYPAKPPKAQDTSKDDKTKGDKEGKKKAKKDD